MGCGECNFLNNTFSEITSNYEYWLFTEMFVYLHNGADHCSPLKQEEIMKNNKRKYVISGIESNDLGVIVNSMIEEADNIEALKEVCEAVLKKLNNG